MTGYDVYFYCEFGNKYLLCINYAFVTLPRGFPIDSISGILQIWINYHQAFHDHTFAIDKEYDLGADWKANDINSWAIKCVLSGS